jgi:hypothetical protein
MWRRVAVVRTDVSEEPVASKFRVEKSYSLTAQDKSKKVNTKAIPVTSRAGL